MNAQSANRAVDLLFNADCLDILPTIGDQSIDLVVADLPYGVTRHACDKQVDLERLWSELRRILTPTGTILMFAQQPFTTDVILAGRDMFKHMLVWEKSTVSNFLHAANMHLRSHEDIIVFSNGTTIHTGRSSRRMTYNPQGLIEAPAKEYKQTNIKFLGKDRIPHNDNGPTARKANYPRSVLKFPKDGSLHSFQKPVALLEYLIRTFSNVGDVVLDPTMGSGSTGVAALNCGRNFVGMEISGEYFDIAEERIEAVSVSETPPTPATPAMTPPCAANDDNPPSATVRLIPAVDIVQQGDCLEAMKAMPDGSVDLIVTSPPYNLRRSQGKVRNITGGAWRGMKLKDGYASYSDDRPYDQYVSWQQECIREMWRLLPEDGAIFYNHKPRVQNGVLQTPLDIVPAECVIRQIIVWDRGSGFNNNRGFFVPQHEWIIVIAKKDWKLKDRKASTLGDVWRIPYDRKNDHPAPFPVELARRAISATNAAIVFDPFSGSGTTGLAAKLEGRKFIGIEIDPGYVEAANARIMRDAA